MEVRFYIRNMVMGRYREERQMVNFRIIYMGCPIYLSLQNCNIIHLFFITELSKINIYILKLQLIVKSKLDNDYIHT